VFSGNVVIFVTIDYMSFIFTVLTCVQGDHVLRASTQDLKLQLNQQSSFNLSLTWVACYASLTWAITLNCTVDISSTYTFYWLLKVVIWAVVLLLGTCICWQCWYRILSSKRYKWHSVTHELFHLCLILLSNNKDIIIHSINNSFCSNLATIKSTNATGNYTQTIDFNLQKMLYWYYFW